MQWNIPWPLLPSWSTWSIRQETVNEWGKWMGVDASSWTEVAIRKGCHRDIYTRPMASCDWAADVPPEASPNAYPWGLGMWGLMLLAIGLSWILWDIILAHCPPCYSPLMMVSTSNVSRCEKWGKVRLCWTLSLANAPESLDLQGWLCLASLCPIHYWKSNIVTMEIKYFTEWLLCARNSF